MGTITIKNLIGGSINITTTGGGGNQDEPVAKTPVWGEGKWVVTGFPDDPDTSYTLRYNSQNDMYVDDDEFPRFLLTDDGTFRDMGITIDIENASQSINLVDGGTLTAIWSES